MNAVKIEANDKKLLHRKHLIIIAYRKIIYYL